MLMHEYERNINTELMSIDLPDEIRDYYNALRDRLVLSYSGEMEPPRVIAISGVDGGEGVSTVSINLAVALSLHGSVLLVDANLPNPKIFDLFQESLKVPLERPKNEKSQALVKVAWNLDFLIACNLEGQCPRLYELPHELALMVNEYKNNYKFVIFDTPPISKASIPVRLGGIVDGMILVVESEKTHKDKLIRAKEQLDQVKTRVLGVVLNKNKDHLPWFLRKK